MKSLASALLMPRAVCFQGNRSSESRTRLYKPNPVSYSGLWLIWFSSEMFQTKINYQAWSKIESKNAVVHAVCSTLHCFHCVIHLCFFYPHNFSVSFALMALARSCPGNKPNYIVAPWHSSVKPSPMPDTHQSHPDWQAAPRGAGEGNWHSGSSGW